MRRLLMMLAAASVCIASAAQAQTSAATAPSQFYVEFAGGPTFGFKTSGSVGGEVGMLWGDHLAVFIEGGRVANSATKDYSAAADVIANFISGTATVKQPVNYGDLGLRYIFSKGERFEPYAVLGVGVAKVRRDTTFAVNGTDVTSQLLPKFGVQVGGDLSGSENKVMVVCGVGTHIRLTDAVFGDASFRLARIPLKEAPLNTSRLQFGIGIRF